MSNSFKSREAFAAWVKEAYWCKAVIEGPSHMGVDMTDAKKAWSDEFNRTVIANGGHSSLVEVMTKHNIGMI